MVLFFFHSLRLEERIPLGASIAHRESADLHLSRNEKDKRLYFIRCTSIGQNWTMKVRWKLQSMVHEQYVQSKLDPLL